MGTSCLIRAALVTLMVTSAVACRGATSRSPATTAGVGATGSASKAGTTPGPAPESEGPEPDPGAASSAGLRAGRAPVSSPPASSARPPGSPAVPSGDRFTDDPVGPSRRSAAGRPNLGGDHHPIVAQEPLGTIEIPKIGLNHPIYEGIELPNLHWGPGHWPGTALPGQFGNAVFAGHRVTHTRPFLDIDRIVPGDEIIFTTPDGHFVYEVTGREIVTADDVRIADPTLTATVTLMACHPKGSALQRYVIRGRLVGG